MVNTHSTQLNSTHLTHSLLILSLLPKNRPLSHCHFILIFSSLCQIDRSSSIHPSIITMPGRPLPIIPSSSSSSSTSSSSSVSSPDHPDSDGPASPFHKNNRFRPILDRFDEMTRNAAEIQSDLLRSIIRDNAGCEYLQQFQGIGALSSSEQVVASATGDADYIDGFKKAIPLITHPDIMPFIERIAEHGNEGSPPGGLLTAAPVQGLCLSSGTTDTRAKYLLYHQGLKEGTVEVASIAAAFREG